MRALLTIYDSNQLLIERLEQAIAELDKMVEGIKTNAATELQTS